MSTSRATLAALVLLPLLAACQSSAPVSDAAPAPVSRLQGQLQLQVGQWLLTPCGSNQTVVINEAGADFQTPAMALLEDGNSRLFVDIGGQKDSAEQFSAQKLYRLQGESLGCNDEFFTSMTLRANGNEPFWSVEIGSQGMLLTRPDQPPLALPYLEEHLGQQLVFSSQANGQDLELWITPKRCIDSMSGAVNHLSATLRFDGAVQQGCAHYGGKRR